MEALLNEMDAKIQTLKFTLGKTQTTIESQNVEALKRHEDSLRQKNRAANDLKENIEEKKICKQRIRRSRGRVVSGNREGPT